MKYLLIAAIGLAVAVPAASAPLIRYIDRPEPARNFFPQSAIWPDPALKGGPERAESRLSGPARIVAVAPKGASRGSGVRIFRGGSVTRAGKAPATMQAGPSGGMTIVRLKKPARNPYKTVIVYTPQSVRTVKTARKAD